MNSWNRIAGINNWTLGLLGPWGSSELLGKVCCMWNAALFFDWGKYLDWRHGLQG